MKRIKALLVLNWQQKASARAQLKLLIEEALDIGLPRAYTPELHQQKCEAVFAHIKQAYPERDIQSTRIRPAEISSPLVKGKSICRPGR